MKPKTLRLLIIGIALLIFGPVVGWVLTMAGLFHTVTTVPPAVSGSLPDIQQTTSGMFTWWFASLIPILAGTVCGAAGLFLTLYALITHFFWSQNVRPNTLLPNYILTFKISLFCLSHLGGAAPPHRKISNIFGQV